MRRNSLLQLPVLEKGTAYLGASLFLPRNMVADAPIRQALTFGLESGREPETLVRMHPYHLEVPRNYLTTQDLRTLGIVKVCDLRPTWASGGALRPKAGFAFRPNQIAPWTALKRAVRQRQDGILRIDTGKGKTILGLRYACEAGGPTLIVSAQEAHLQNWVDELTARFELDGQVGWIRGKKMEYEAPVVLATIHTLARRSLEGKLPTDFHTRFALAIFDECHHQAAPAFSKGSDLTWGLRLGLTATLTRRDRCEGMVLYHLGPVLYDDPSLDSLIPHVELHETGTELAADDPDILDVTGEPNVSKLRGKLGTLTARNRKILAVVSKRIQEGHTVYVITHSVAHAVLLADLCTSAGFSTGLLTGLEKNAKERLRQLHVGKVVVATLFVGKENYNRPDLSCLVLTTPLSVDDYAPTEFVQVVGRVLRPLSGKPDPHVDLFLDSGVPQSAGMLRTVTAWCRSEGWEVTGDTWTRRKSTPRAWQV